MFRQTVCIRALDAVRVYGYSQRQHREKSIQRCSPTSIEQSIKHFTTYFDPASIMGAENVKSNSQQDQVLLLLLNIVLLGHCKGGGGENLKSEGDLKNQRQKPSLFEILNISAQNLFTLYY